MRIVYHGFQDGTYHLFQTDKDAKNRQTLEDTRPDVRVRRLMVFIEAACEDDEQSLHGVQAGLDKIARALGRESALVSG